MGESLLIRGGTVVDGNGAASQTADVLVVDGLIAEVGRIEKPDAKIVDADGLLVTPGWVDSHTHYDGQVYWDPLMTPSSWHGATTAIMGNCGVGFAPARADQQEFLMELMQSIEDIPVETLRAGIPWGWESFGEYLDSLDATPRAIDMGVLVPHGVVRTYLMGERGEKGEATPEEIDAMCRVIGHAIDAGALGCSANRTLLKDGFVPGSFAKDEELLAIARTVGQRDGSFQTNPASYYGPEEWAPYDKETDLMVRMSMAGNMRITFPLIEDHQEPGRWRWILDQIEQANAAGAKMFPQILARPLNAIMTLAGRHPFDRMPAYEKVAAAGGSNSELAARLRQSDVRESVLGPAREALADRAWFFDTMYLMTDPLDYEPETSESIGAKAKRDGVTSMDMFYDLMTAGKGDAMFLAVVANYAEGNANTVMEMIRHPDTITGLGDGGAHQLGLCDVTTPTTVMTQWVRDRTRGPKLPVEEAVRALSSSPARAFGLTDRGVLAPGMRADINLIDMDALRMELPEFIHDLPADGRRMVQRARGYVATFVAGEQILADGEDMGARPGRTIRRKPAREKAPA
ncbi:MAG: amidohydrolase family protein [Novosphingobium sp.]|nr:amidohydrolase family protein [Novosphingobium sp.]